ncbi:MAG: guanylate kinase [Thermoanaerobacter sp.]|uniref:guanylate kinase n=1 Tax=unclassified Thermoanaerobacter TaxID=2636821 RepID=UPI0000E1E250|nr:guanylate kinase [Thermoanaerobacter sp. X514]MBZ4656465.1 guanylate kinase [Thermoanaerobacter sp.]ABY93047.1 Guanylate kinase [Thermoanaerobacter sp. X514]MDI3500989.1 guanylate kinase [Thermoanaerobacter sp.]MDI3528240.1 guanylate kinase [Thermoanaerobacter sp.]MDK2814184.1 guanylate kinase [Thermoanaerobacter sp.]
MLSKKKKGLLIVLSGPSGAGKGTICKALMEKEKDLKLSISATTRQPRSGEIEGKNYFFKSEEEFEKMIENDSFLEWAKVYGHYYGTPKDFVLKNLDEGNDVVLEIDIQGALKIKEKFPEGVFIFILPPSMEELKNRIKKRGTETEEEIIKRFKSAYEELNYVSRYNYVVINDSVEEAVEKIKAIIIAEKCRVDRNKDLYLEIKEGLV